MDSFLSPSVSGGFGSTPTMVMPRSNGSDSGVPFGAETAGGSKELFALTRSKSEGWKVGEGWLYCGLEKVDVEAATLGSNPTAAYINVTESNGEFSAQISAQENQNAVVSIKLYEFEDGKLKRDGRNVIFVPLYN